MPIVQVCVLWFQNSETFFFVLVIVIGTFSFFAQNNFYFFIQNKLANTCFLDTKFAVDFLAVFREVMTCGEVLNAIERALLVDNVTEATITHILSFLRSWIQVYPIDLVENNDLYSRIEQLLARLASQHNAARDLHAIVRAQVDITRQQRRVSEDALVNLATTTIDMAKAAAELTLASKPIDVARQLTLVESQVFSQVLLLRLFCSVS